MASHPVVSLRGVTCTADGRDLLRGITWEVRRGEHWAILGPNGSGKTTLLKLLAGYAHPAAGAGAMTVLGAAWGHEDWRDLRTRIGFASSAIEERFPGAEPALDVVASGFAATLGLYAPPTAAERRRAAAALARLDAGRLAAAAWMDLSQGERQRVLIARALVHDPELLVLDEPCAGLDLVAREDLLDAVGRLGARAGGPTMLLVTHHAEEVLPVFGRTLLLRAGAVLAAGPTGDVLTAPRLTALFGREVEVERRDGRRWARPAPRGR